MGIIPQTKYGDCSSCPATDTMVVKIGKDLFCLQCNREIKTAKQTEKAKERDKIRSLGHKQVQQGNYEDASVQALKNDLDFVHSRLVRIMAADERGLAHCFTCDKVQHWSMMQLSHFIKRANTLTRWDSRANRCCCKYCNETLDGNLKVFAERLNAEQPGLTEQLTEIARDTYKWGRDEMKQLLSDLRAKLRIAEARLNSKPQ